MIFILGTYSTSIPIIDLLRENNIISELKMIIDTAYNSPSAFAFELGSVLKHILNVVFANFGDIWLSFLGLIFLGIIIPYILFQISSYNITSLLYQKFTMNMNVPYIQNGLSILKHSIVYAFVSIVLNIPFFLIIVLFGLEWLLSLQSALLQ